MAINLQKLIHTDMVLKIITVDAKYVESKPREFGAPKISIKRSWNDDIFYHLGIYWFFTLVRLHV